MHLENLPLLEEDTSKKTGSFVNPQDTVAAESIDRSTV